MGSSIVTAASDNPFAEPEDDDSTIIVSREALSALAMRQQERAAEGPRASDDDGEFSKLPFAGTSPIIAAASPLLSLVARLRNVVSVPDPLSLRERTILELQRYEATLRDAKVASEQLRLAHYVLCSTLDDVVQCTPWGSGGSWAEASLTSTFHRDTHGGERFFDILTKLLASPSQYLPLIELMYTCMSLGMFGRHRLSPRGPAELDRVREETYAVICRIRGAAPAELSPHWQGLATPFKPLRLEIPIWFASLIGLGILGLAYAFFVLNLAVQSDRVFETVATLPPTGMPGIVRVEPALPPPSTPELPGLRTRLLAALAQDIHDGRLFVEGTEAIPVLRLQSEGMFDLGKADVVLQYRPVLQRIATVLAQQGGSVQVVGYTDVQPIHTIAFPSNYDLSLARARAATQLMAQAIDPNRIRVTGEGAMHPRGDNSTVDGRRANRRVEIVVGASGATDTARPLLTAVPDGR